MAGERAAVRIPGQRGNPGLKGRLLSNSVDAYILALETINRMSVTYRVEAFCVLICMAWESLLKAKIIHDTGRPQSIYYKKERGAPRRTLSLSDCLSRIYANDRDPVRRNVERVLIVRNEAVHLCISEIPKNVIGVFQACVLNYHGQLGIWFDISLHSLIPTGMMTFVFDASMDQFSTNIVDLRKKIGAETLKFLMEQEAQIAEEADSLDKSTGYSIIFEHKFGMEKRAIAEVIKFISGDDDIPTVAIATPKRADLTHPHRCKEVAESVNQRIGQDGLFTTYDITAVVAVHKIEGKADMFYHSTVKSSPKTYSG